MQKQIQVKNKKSVSLADYLLAIMRSDMSVSKPDNPYLLSGNELMKLIMQKPGSDFNPKFNRK